eukprot:5229580-Amphidinium_carterae.1
MVGTINLGTSVLFTICMGMKVGSRAAVVTFGQMLFYDLRHFAFRSTFASLQFHSTLGATRL